MLSYLVALLTCVVLVASLRLEVLAKANPEPFCIRDFAMEGQLVVVNIDSNGRMNDGMKMEVTVGDSLGNEHRRLKDIHGKAKITFTSHHSVAFDVCFYNRMEPHMRGYLFREVEVEIESGAAARDWNAIQAADKLKPNEVALRRIEEVVGEIVSELNYLKGREARMRDTNESTYSRVQFFSSLIIVLLVVLGAWQIQYLRSYFKAKHII